MKIDGLILAAGSSKRSNGLKSLFMYENYPFIVCIIKKLFQVVNEVVVVLGYENELIVNEIKKYFSNKEMDRIKITINNNYQDGMFSSLQVGLRACLDSDWIMYHFVDQPDLPINLYNQLINSIDNRYDWIQPSFQNRLGHPILLNKNMFNIILNEPLYSNLKDVKLKHKLNSNIIETTYSEILNDVDTENDYKKIINKSYGNN